MPDVFAADADCFARFRREAQVLASLNHRHFGTIFGLEETGGAAALVLELVEGPTLAIGSRGRRFRSAKRQRHAISRRLHLDLSRPELGTDDRSIQPTYSCTMLASDARGS
ncbi:MAG: hypothetical protein DMF92_15670, partial [Acidobacteria bacterium]